MTGRAQDAKQVGLLLAGDGKRRKEEEGWTRTGRRNRRGMRHCVVGRVGRLREKTKGNRGLEMKKKKKKKKPMNVD
ncbi:hypothetical protein HZU67_09001 [Apis mellifera carnica]|nr:hypothetical protein HZU67_09001 [Apis mellifera carnica]